MDVLHFISSLQPDLLYPVIFIGHVFLGGFILMPALYLSVIGKVSFFVLLAIIVASSMVSDSFWYMLGKNLGKEKIYSLPLIKRKVVEAKKFSHFYDTYGVWTVFFTKFISGTRLASHILAGMHDVDYIKFLLATGTGTTIWFTAMFGLVKWFDKGIAGSSTASFRLQLLAIAIVVILVALNWFTGTYLRKKLMNRK